MSTAASSTAAETLVPEGQSAAAHQPKDHVPHVLPLRVYFGVFFALLVFTAITVGVSYIDLGDTFNLALAMFVATCKGLMVALIFMHLWWDSKFNALVFSSSLLFLALFITFTLFDTKTRGRLDPVEGARPADVTQPFDGPNPAVDSTRRGTR